jgi:hypothetical protein
MARGTSSDWLTWLVSLDDDLVMEARLALGGTAPGTGVDIAPLIEGLCSSNPTIAFWSLMGLTGLGTEASCAQPVVIQRGCSHSSFGIRQASARALSKFTTSETSAACALLSLIDDEHALVRREALQALSTFVNLSEADMARIRSKCADDDPDVARWAELAQRRIRGAV